MPQYRLRDGATLSAENVEACLPYEQAFAASFPVFLELREKHARPDLPFQVGIPGQLDLSVDTFGFDVGFDPRYYQPSLEATASQVNKIAAAGGSDVVFQIETPAALISVTSAGEAAAEQTARQVAAHDRPASRCRTRGHQVRRAPVPRRPQPQVDGRHAGHQPGRARREPDRRGLAG